MEGLWKGLADLGHSVVNIASPEGWGFAALAVTCVGMMWYFNSAGHRMRIAEALDKNLENKRILNLSQEAIAEAFEFKHKKGEITDKDKDAMYAFVYKNIPKMHELKPDGAKSIVATSLIGVGAKLRTKWPFRSKADEARADLASLVNSINAAKK